MNREVIVACDFSNFEEFKLFIDKFETKLFLKIGMELFYKEGNSVVEYAKSLGHKIFLDLKLNDIPNTVYKALKNIAELNVEFVTVHATGGYEMLNEVAKALEGTNTKALAVTVLTSFDEDSLNKIGIKSSVDEQVLLLANLAKDCNIYGIICSPNEVQLIKEKVDIACVTPGIRMLGDNSNDQKRIATPKKAFDMGSDYIVVGRSITEAEDVVAAYNRCINEFGE